MSKTRIILWIIAIFFFFIVAREISPLLFIGSLSSPTSKEIEYHELLADELENLNAPVIIYEEETATSAYLAQQESMLSLHSKSEEVGPRKETIKPSASVRDSFETQKEDEEVEDEEEEEEYFTSIVKGMQKQRIHISTERDASYISVLSARIKRIDKQSDGWDALSMLIVFNSLNQSKTSNAGCVSWICENIESYGKLSWFGEDGKNNNNNYNEKKKKKKTYKLSRGICSPGWQRQRLFGKTDVSNKIDGKSSTREIGQLCYGFIDFPLPPRRFTAAPTSLGKEEEEEEEERMAVDVRHALQTSRVKLELDVIVNHPNHLKDQVSQDEFKPLIIPSSSSSFKNHASFNLLLEARNKLPRPLVSMCLDSLFGNAAAPALEFLSYQKLIGVEVYH
jgi:hypothetical protein